MEQSLHHVKTQPRPHRPLAQSVPAALAALVALVVLACWLQQAYLLAHPSHSFAAVRGLCSNM